MSDASSAVMLMSTLLQTKRPLRPLPGLHCQYLRHLLREIGGGERLGEDWIACNAARYCRRSSSINPSSMRIRIP